MDAHRITLHLAEGLAGNHLHLSKAMELELPEQYSTCQVVGLRLLLLLLKMVAVGVDRKITAELAELAEVAEVAELAEDQVI